MSHGFQFTTVGEDLGDGGELGLLESRGKIQIPHKTEQTMKRSESGCIPITQPTAAEKAKARKSFVNRARALLTLLGYDPTPDNVSKIVTDPQDEKILIINNRRFKVLDNEETLKELELIMLTYPKRLPAKFLALFLTGAFSRDPNLDFSVIVTVAAALRKDMSLESNWALHKMIALDPHISSHIQEVIDHTGIEQLFPGSEGKVSQVTWHTSNYTIIELPPKGSLLDSYGCQEENLGVPGIC